MSPYNWHGGASSIDVDATEDRLLPTSFITSLLQENKDHRRANRTSYASTALTGISEMTYPPLMNHSVSGNIISARYSSARVAPHRPQDSLPPPSSFPQPSNLSNPSKRVSGDSETLHSIQGHPSIIRTASISRTPVPGTSVVGITSATLRNISPSGQATSTHDYDSDTLRDMEKAYQRKLFTTHESDDELLANYKSFDPDYSPALPSTAGTQRRFLRDSARPDPNSRNSMHSNKSAAPSLFSRISGISSIRRVFTWRKVKPLPPVPIIPNIPISVEAAHRKEEELTPLPDLVNRAGVLHDLLDRDQHPHRSFISQPGFLERSAPYDGYEHQRRKVVFLGYPGPTPPRVLPSNGHPIISTNLVPRKNKRLCIMISIFIIAALAALGAGVGATVGKNKGGKFNCPANFTGASCNLDASCVCTSSTQCNGLAQSIVDLLPIVNREFNMNFTSPSAYSSIWMMQGSTTGSNCASQALVLDVGNGINETSYPNRTQWVQAALLWNALQTQDIDSSQKMQKFVQSLPWKTLGDADGPVDGDPAFVTTISGFSYNFASQILSQPPASFITLGQPANAQIARVSSGAQVTLDRMYSFALASATQRQIALKKYWTSVLAQRGEDLNLFKTALSVSPILLPFNATSRAIRNLYGSTPSSPFPPPLACLPGLSTTVLRQVNSVESTVFGLTPTTGATQFDPSCFRERPVYGVLDVLHLRLPFLDSRTGVVRQAAVLARDAASRVILHTGELWSTMFNGTGATNVTTSQLDQRQYGTLSLSDHVILQYLSSFPDIGTANALIRFVLDSATRIPVPPEKTSALFQSLPSLPILEVAVFGDVLPLDLTSTIAPFASPSGALFFGSEDGSALRNWTIHVIGGSIVWTENATSPLAVRDKSLGDTTITQTWNAIALAITHNVPGIGLPNITATFQGTRDFSP